jgi:hypothetical protein
LEKITLNYNYGILQLVNKDRLYTTGTLSASTIGFNESDTPIWGATSEVGARINSLFEKAYSDIDSDLNPIISSLLNKGFGNISPAVNGVKTNMKEYLKGVRSEFENGITTITQEFVTFEQKYVQLFRKLNLVTSSTDGKLLQGNVPRVYNLSSTTEVSQTSTESSPVPTNTAEELGYDYKKVYQALKDYNDYLSVTIPNKVITTEYNNGEFIPISNSNEFKKTVVQTFFMIMGRILTNKDKKNTFIDSVIKGNLLQINDPLNLKNQFTKIVNDLANEFEKEIKLEDKLFKDLRKDKEFKPFLDSPDDKLYPKGKTRKFNYSTLPNPSTNTAQGQQIISLYSTQVTDGDKKTFNGKVTFN